MASPESLRHPLQPTSSDVAAVTTQLTTSSSPKFETASSFLSEQDASRQFHAFPAASETSNSEAVMVASQSTMTTKTGTPGVGVGPMRTQARRTKQRVIGKGICGVCGDRAFAHNFGVLTCETCKAFFRRNASKVQEIPPCSFNKNCVINKTTRRFCTYCRMQKCFAVGMDPLLILDDEAKKAIQTRRREKQRDQGEMVMWVDSSTSSLPHLMQQATTSFSQLIHSTDPSSTTDSTDSDLLSLGPSPLSADNSSYHSGYITALEGAVKKIETGCTAGSSPTESPASQCSTDISTATCPTQLSEPFLTLGRRFRHVEREELPWDFKLYWPLKEEERYLLTSLSTSYNQIQTTPPDFLPSENIRPDQPLCLDNIMLILEAVVRKCVHFAKTVPHFRDLLQADQIAILKSSVLNTHLVRCAALFIVEKGAWSSCLGDVHRNDIQKLFGDPSVELVGDFCASLKSVVKANMTIYGLLHCITLFDVRKAKLEDFAKVSAIQDTYVVLLKHYLESEYSYMHASRYMAELMALLEDMHSLRQKLAPLNRRFSNFFKPLMSEMLDIEFTD